MKKGLPAGYRFMDLTPDEFQKYFDEWHPRIFTANGLDLDLALVLSEEEKVRVRDLGKNTAQLTRIILGIFKGETFCGWCSGDQYSRDTFYMRNSAILPEFRRQGLYSAALNETVERARALGFQVITSRHNNVNNAVIIPKLKFGFVISGMEVSDRFGVLVSLSYFFNETRRKVMEFRSGELKPDATLRQALGMT